jgi:hypothetical protein
MLGNVKVRTKLMAVLAAPVLALVAVAGIGFTDRAALARETRTVGELTRLATRSSGVVRELGRESVLSAGVLAGVLAGTTEVEANDLEEQRDQTDLAIEELQLARGAIDAGSLDESVRTAIDDGLDQLGLVTPHRASVDSRLATVDSSVRVYAQLADQLLGATQERVRTLVEAQETQYAVFNTGAAPDQKVGLRNALAESASIAVDRLRSDVLDAEPRSVSTSTSGPTRRARSSRCSRVSTSRSPTASSAPPTRSAATQSATSGPTWCWPAGPPSWRSCSPCSWAGRPSGRCSGSPKRRTQCRSGSFPG